MASHQCSQGTSCLCKQPAPAFPAFHFLCLQVCAGTWSTSSLAQRRSGSGSSFPGHRASGRQRRDAGSPHAPAVHAPAGGRQPPGGSFSQDACSMVLLPVRAVQLCHAGCHCSAWTALRVRATILLQVTACTSLCTWSSDRQTKADACRPSTPSLWCCAPRWLSWTHMRAAPCTLHSPLWLRPEALWQRRKTAGLSYGRRSSPS